MTADAEKNQHDLQNQLSIILGFSQLLLSDAPDESPRRGDLEAIVAAATAALDVVARLLPPEVDVPSMTAGPAPPIVED